MITISGGQHMKIGIIVHSKTGHTLSVAEKLKAALLGVAHEAEILRVSAADEDAAIKGKITLLSVPDISGFDSLVFAAPVWGFSLSPVMQKYLSSVSDLSGRRSACFVSMQFPFPCLGGNRSIRQFKAVLAAKGSAPSETGIINWSGKKREEQIAGLVKRICRIF